MIKTLALSSIEVIGNGFIGLIASGLGTFMAMYIHDRLIVKGDPYKCLNTRYIFALIYIG